MEKEWTNNYGKITIAKEVISKIAGIAAMECYGLVGMASVKVQDGIAQLLGWENLSKGVIVDIEGDNVRLELNIIVEYGTNIHQVANNIIERVSYTLKEKVGIVASPIDVNVQGVRVGNAGR
ncbi:MAG TPA: Asp23/Gls24 family envelope stress response protein [Halanaerobiaceae bacterium]|nr:Asp23/Gls24 family envelope stress response protein [Bacillota bacterium]HHU92764.1 Asp23/Gls24 family envelope stress response protein [Halanaerobiaceae bacterium]HOA40252.1 Asp23/Gls24 family envelope stress response protein [Halanaerobiales bacterium]HPZ62405.1 Asp23/Gls24 family envelope stress response protein [Halanaerobiales bacterium]HQD03803.1 Asp23/Gls24 family envelope stress response protein [Halanaerobiales bacterium]